MNANILVIDDELTICKSCQRLLSEDGYSVDMVLSGREGLRRAIEGNFDLLIVDLKLSDIDGMEIVEAVKKNRSNVEVIIMTGYSTVQSAVKGMKLGAADYVCKPFTPDEMSTAVKKALQHKEQMAEAKDDELFINKEAIIAVLTKAAEDKEFAARISNAGQDTLRDYDLSPMEKSALVSVMQSHDEEAMHLVSHELKSPLSSIANLARAIQEPDVPGDQKEKFLMRIITRAESGIAMIEEYLALSAINAGELKIVPRKVSLYKEVIEKSLDDQKEAMDKQKMHAIIDVPVKLNIFCDPRYIRIVYNNLISNATKYGTASTEIDIGYSGLRDGYHYLNVANAGEWIKDGDRERIFEKYVTLQKKGTGIGLHATMEILKKHDGTIWVESCYLIGGRCLAADSIIEGTTTTGKVSERLIKGNNFIFTLPERNNIL